MNRAKIAAGTIAAFLLLTSSATPQTMSASKACFHDINRHCGRVKHGGGRLQACIDAHFDKLSATCQALVNRAKPVARACRADVDRYCGNVKPGLWRLGLCIHSNGGKFSSGCKSAFSRKAANLR